MYNNVSKIIISRIRPFLGKLVSPVQSAFAPRRKYLDYIIIAQELIHSLDSKKGKMGFMAINVDLAKAYDKLEWNFIQKILKDFHFP